MDTWDTECLSEVANTMILDKLHATAATYTLLRKKVTFHLVLEERAADIKR